VNALRGALYLLNSHLTAPFPRSPEEATRDMDNALSLRYGPYLGPWLRVDKAPI